MTQPPQNLSVKLPHDVSALLRRTAYKTGRSKTSLVIEAIRQVYGHGAQEGPK